MFAFVTGASSGIGRDIAIYLGSLGYDIIATGRNKERLEELKEYINTNVICIAKELSFVDDCKELYEEIKKYDIEVFVNNAGFGTFGYFDETDLNTEINMINTNIVAMHILFKNILKDMIVKDKGYILNVSSLASFMPGPLMATYYSTKVYVTRISESVIKELSKKKSNVKVSVLCPGPVKTNFNNVAGVKFGIEPLSSKYVAKYSIDKMFKGKKYIIPGFKNRLSSISGKLLPNNLISEFTFYIQKKKISNQANNKKSKLN